MLCHTNQDLTLTLTNTLSVGWFAIQIKFANLSESYLWTVFVIRNFS